MGRRYPWPSSDEDEKKQSEGIPHHCTVANFADTFGQAPIILDGKSLAGGAITNAVFAYYGGAVELNNVKIDKGSVRLEFGGAAANTVRFMAAWEQLENHLQRDIDQLFQLERATLHQFLHGEILSTPLNGLYISRMMKTAEETAIAPRANATTTVEFGEAKRPKLAKMTASHETTTSRSGKGTAFCSDLRNRSHWVCRKARIREMDWALVAACAPFFGVRSSIWSKTISPYLIGLSSAARDDSSGQTRWRPASTI